MTETELKPLSKKHQRVLDEYLVCWVQWRAYTKVYPKSSPEVARTLASRLFADDNFKGHLQLRYDEAHMSAENALKNLSDIANGDIGVFWKIIDEWMYNPLPEYEILHEKEVMRESEDGTKEKVVMYRVRHVALDMDKIIDPRYSHLIQEFTDSRKNGLSIKTYNRHDANRDILKVHGRFAPDKIDLSNSDGSLKPVEDKQVLDRVNQLIELAKQRKAKAEK